MACIMCMDKALMEIMGTCQLMENYQNLNPNNSMLGIHNVLPTPTGCTDWWCANPQMSGVGCESIYIGDIMEIKHFVYDVKKPHRVCWIRFSSMQSALWRRYWFNSNDRNYVLVLFLLYLTNYSWLYYLYFLYYFYIFYVYHTLIIILI